jgi:hypothetical protein
MKDNQEPSIEDEPSLWGGMSGKVENNPTLTCLPRNLRSSATTSLPKITDL